MPNSDENWRGMVEKFRFSPGTIFHSARWDIKLKYDRGERVASLSHKSENQKIGERRGEALSLESRKRGRHSSPRGSKCPVVWFAWNLHELDGLMDRAP
ncbi:hypothetical protein AVEN_269265-1 [Araneus ventricosus]|uniref:Uncharacterized protein n=1 Tax=Araneus ventricosus TaxID=182803 RepID=A0A4Y2SM88_ARAVE|nr:hypothetical protein AVEN_269265-1 [Araneus ventricosus]